MNGLVVTWCFLHMSLLDSYQGYLFSTRHVCYKDLGCFSTGPPFSSPQRLIVVLPDTPSKINTTFHVCTRRNPACARVDASNFAKMKYTSYNASNPTRFIIHGFIDSKENVWVSNMSKELLTNDDTNVILVDWRNGALVPYAQATANTRVVGAEIARLIQYLYYQTNGNERIYVHLIGHSLGAHVTGYAAARMKVLGLPKLQRISGLDPAGLHFENSHPTVRLDRSDANFVDVIHTDATSFINLGLGLKQDIGHVDFYPNGGKAQPGCANGLLKKATSGIWNMMKLNYTGVEMSFSCSHMRVTRLYTESINSPCPMTSYSCSSYADFQRGMCVTCTLGRPCQLMGFHADKFRNVHGRFFLQTAAVPPYCSWPYVVALKIAMKQKLNYGEIKIGLVGSRITMPLTQYIEPNSLIKKGTMLTKLVVTNKDLGGVRGVRIKYDRSATYLGWMYGSRVRVESI